jgi:O-antigen/teichoic acid export membrane protein
VRIVSALHGATTVWPSGLPVRALASTAGVSLVLAGMAVVTGPLTARALGADGRGALVALQAWPLLFATIGSFGLTEATAYFAATDARRSRAGLVTPLLLAAPVAIAAVVAGWWIVPLALGADNAQWRGLSRLSLLLVPLLLLGSASHQALRGGRRYGPWNAIRLVMPAAWLAGVTAVWWTGHGDVRLLAVSFIAAAALFAAAGCATAWRLLEGPATFDRSLARPMLAYGGPTMMTSMPQWLNVRLDQLLMIALLDTHAIGLYAVAVAWGGAAQPLSTVLAHVTVPTLAGSRDPQERARALYRAGVAAALVSGLALLAATPLFEPMVFGREFAAAVPAALIMAVAGTLMGVNAVGAECLRGIGRPRAPLIAESVGLVVTVLSLPVLIPLAGIVGAAASSVVSYAAIMIVQRRLLATTEPVAAMAGAV